MLNSGPAPQALAPIRRTETGNSRLREDSRIAPPDGLSLCAAAAGVNPWNEAHPGVSAPWQTGTLCCKLRMVSVKLSGGAMKRRNFALFGAGSCFLLLGTAVLAFQAGGGYHLLKKISLGAAEGGGEYFDYITFDAAARRVYLSHGTEVEVLDADSGSAAGKVTGLKRDHGVALVPQLGRGFITDGDAGQ